MKRLSSTGPGAPKAVPSPGAVSSVGPSGKAPTPRIKNTRDYGKKEPPITMGPPITPYPQSR